MPREAVGTASGIYSMMRQLGGVVGVAALAAVFAAAGGFESFAIGFARAMTVCGVLSLLRAAAGLRIALRRRTSPEALAAAREPVGELR